MFKYDSKTFLPSDQREREITNDDFKLLWEQELNEISDEENPEFMFQTMHMKLVLAIANGKITTKTNHHGGYSLSYFLKPCSFCFAWYAQSNVWCSSPGWR